MSEELEFPVLDGLLAQHIDQGAAIKRRKQEYCLVAVDGEVLAYGATISSMLSDLILRDA